MKPVISSVAAALVVATAAVAYSQGIEWALVNWKVRHDFSTVARVDPKQVADLLNNPKRPQPVLLDVRTKPGYELSHIHGAQ
ncbi:MAG: rhodanese-like domain-containing protein, partial [Chthoniobacterales bacterium]